MKQILLLAIRIYWLTIPASKRRRCIFRVSCSKHVYHTAKEQGFYKGIEAFRYRHASCRNGFQVFDHPIDGSKMIMLTSGEVLPTAEISERFI